MIVLNVCTVSYVSSGNTKQVLVVSFLVHSTIM